MPFRRLDGRHWTMRFIGLLGFRSGEVSSPFEWLENSKRFSSGLLIHLLFELFGVLFYIPFWRNGCTLLQDSSYHFNKMFHVLIKKKMVFGKGSAEGLPLQIL